METTLFSAGIKNTINNKSSQVFGSCPNSPLGKTRHYNLFSINYDIFDENWIEIDEYLPLHFDLNYT